MKKTLLNFISSAVLVSGIFGLIKPVAAHPPLPLNSLVKSSGPAVYWVAENGKRYVFPNLKTFWSWYPSDKLTEVRNISESEMAEIPYGGVVTYRPGAKLVKVPSSPKVYAVSRYGVLHHITREVLAVHHYGINWKDRVEDIPESFFVNYTVGTPMINTWDYNGGIEYNGVTTPSVNLLDNLSLDALAVSLSKYEVTKGESVTLTANLASNAQIKDVIIEFFGENTTTALKTCSGATTCSVQVALTGTEVTRDFRARATYTTPTGKKTIDSNVTTLRLMMPQLTLSGTALASAEVIAPSNGQPVVRVVTTAVNTSALDPDLSIRIYSAQDQHLLTTCTGSVSCVGKDSLPYITDTTEAKYFAIVSDKTNQALAPAYTSVTVLPKGWYPAYNSYTFTASEYGSKTSQTQDIDQEAKDIKLEYALVQSNGKFLRSSDDNATVAPGSPVRVEAKVVAPKVTDSLNVEVLANDNIIYKTCTGKGSVVCVSDMVLASDYKNYFFTVRVKDQNNRQRDFRLADYVYMGGKQGFGGKVRVISDRTVAKRGETVYLSTKIMNETFPIAKLTTQIYNLETGKIVATCVWTTECRTKTVIDTDLTQLNYYAVVVDPQGREMHASFLDNHVKVIDDRQ